jgi:hypothetical protein
VSWVPSAGGLGTYLIMATWTAHNSRACDEVRQTQWTSAQARVGGIHKSEDLDDDIQDVSRCYGHGSKADSASADD